MKLPRPLLVRLSPLVEAARGDPLVEPFVELKEDSELRLHLASSYGEFVFQRDLRSITRDGVEVSSFDAVQTVDIGSFPGGRGARTWSISLYRGIVDRITVARTYDAGAASIVAARLGRVLGRKVVALTRPR